MLPFRCDLILGVLQLHAMLKLHEQTLNLPKNNAPALHAIRAIAIAKESGITK
ncbi:hypothetical protein Tco_0476733, partial [Tanacetum coccineum]